MVEQDGGVEAGAGGDLGHRGLGRGQLDRPGAAAVHELELGDLGDRGDDLRRGARARRGRARLHRAGSRRCARACPATVVADARRSGPRRPSARRGSRRSRRSISRASARPASAVRTGERLGPILTMPPSGHQETSMSIATRIGATNDAARLLDQVEVLGASRPSRRAPRRGARRSAARGGSARRGRRSGRRRPGRACPSPTSHRVSGRVKMSRPWKPRSRSSRRSSTGRQRTDFLATRIGLPGRAAQHVGGVRPDGVEVDEGERRLHAVEDLLVALVGLASARDGQRRRRVARVPLAARGLRCGAGVVGVGSRLRRHLRASLQSGPFARRGGRAAEGTRLLSE